MPIDPSAPGAPLSIYPAPYEQVVSSFGDFAAGDGGIIKLTAGALCFSIHLNGAHAEIGITLEDLLESIGEFNKRTGS